MTTKETFIEEREREFERLFPDAQHGFDNSGLDVPKDYVINPKEALAFHRETISLLAGKLIEALDGGRKYAKTTISSTDHGNIQNALLAEHVISFNAGLDRAIELVKERFNVEKE